MAGTDARSPSASGFLLLAIDGASKPQWRTDTLGKIYVTSRTLSLSGSCPRGTFGAKLTVGGTPIGDPTACTGASTFSVSHTVSADGEYTVVVQPVNRGGNPQGGAISVTVVVDTVAPAAPVITTNSGQNIFSLRPDLLIEGTTAVDTQSLLISGNGTTSYVKNAPTFSHSLLLAQGQTRQLTVYALDFAGNRSDPATITVSFLSALSLLDAGFTGLRSGAPVEATDGLSHSLFLHNLTSNEISSVTQPQLDLSGELNLLTGRSQISSQLLDDEGSI